MTKETTKVITIDGPSASGKSTVSRRLAHRLGWKWVSTGVFYRGLGLLMSEEGIDVDDEASIMPFLIDPPFEVALEPDQTRFVLKGRDRTGEIHGEVVGGLASRVSAHPKVRQALLDLQRSCASKAGLVAEGRDCGTVVFPQAPLKVYLTAQAHKRAQRRSVESEASFGDTLDQQKKRDFDDSHRKAAPLEPAEGAFVVDSSDLSLDQVVEQIVLRARRQFPKLSF